MQTFGVLLSGRLLNEVVASVSQRVRPIPSLLVTCSMPGGVVVGIT